MDVPVGNQWVVPYNPYLLFLLDCHICTDVVTAASCANYLYKYISKGNDFAKAKIAGIKSEIEMYRTARYLSASEATWKMLGFETNSRYPSVTRVHAHLEQDNNVIYPADASPEERAAIANNSASQLMHYLKRPNLVSFNGLTLLDYFEKYIVEKKKEDDPVPTSAPVCKWFDQYGNIVSTRTTDHVCRIHLKSPAVGDVFYLRLLLYKIPARSFMKLRIVHPAVGPAIVYPNFHDAARARGLVTGDQEYFICMQEAVLFQTANLLRGLLVTLILDGAAAPKLWRELQEDLIEDLRMSMTRNQAIAQALREIDLKLQLHGKDNEPSTRYPPTD